MSVLSYDAGDAFTVRIIKALTSNPDNSWGNTYELKAGAAGSEDELLAAASKIVAFEKKMHSSVVSFLRLLISTWEPDSVPYDPAAFISSAITGLGQRSNTGNPMALQTCLSVARVCASGRLGHLFYRGVLEESDIQAPAGKNVLTDKAAQQGYMDTAITDFDFDSLIGSAGLAGLGLHMIGDTIATARPVMGLVIVGVAQVPNDHAWYNRSSIVVP